MGPGAARSRVLRLPTVGAAPEGHPAGIWVPEDSLVSGVHAFFAERIFGPDRAALLAEQLRGIESSAAAEQGREMDSIRRRLEEAATRRKRLVRSLEFTDDRDGELARDVGIRLSELRVGADELTAALRSLEESQDPIPTPELLDALPVTGPDLARVSDEASAGAVRRLPPGDHLRQADPHRPVPGNPSPPTPCRGRSRPPLVIMQPSGLCPQRDSNQCYRLERPVKSAGPAVQSVLSLSRAGLRVLEWLDRRLVRPTNRSTTAQLHPTSRESCVAATGLIGASAPHACAADVLQHPRCPPRIAAARPS